MFFDIVSGYYYENQSQLEYLFLYSMNIIHQPLTKVGLYLSLLKKLRGWHKTNHLFFKYE